MNKSKYLFSSSVAAVSVSALAFLSKKLDSAGEKASAADLLVLNGADLVVAIGVGRSSGGGVTALGLGLGGNFTAVVFSTAEDGQTRSRSCGNNSRDGEDGSESELHVEGGS